MYPNPIRNGLTAMRYRRRAIIAGICGFAMATSQTFALDALPWRLADYPDGGELLTAAVADSLTSSGVLIGPTCNALGTGSVPQIASGVAGIAQSIAGSDNDNAATIIDGLPACCTVMTSTDADTRISLGVAIAMKARGLAETDLQSAQEVESFVDVCDDDVLGRSYELARGNDNLGTLIAEADDPGEPGVPIDRSPGGGAASNS